MDGCFYLNNGLINVEIAVQFALNGIANLVSTI
jgi:hypothetical protein